MSAQRPVSGPLTGFDQQLDMDGGRHDIARQTRQERLFTPAPAQLEGQTSLGELEPTAQPTSAGRHPCRYGEGNTEPNTDQEGRPMTDQVKLRGQVPAWDKAGNKTAFGRAGHDFTYERAGTFTDADGDAYAELRTNPGGTIYLVPVLDLSSYEVRA